MKRVRANHSPKQSDPEMCELNANRYRKGKKRNSCRIYAIAANLNRTDEVPENFIVAGSIPNLRHAIYRRVYFIGNRCHVISICSDKNQLFADSLRISRCVPKKKEERKQCDSFVVTHSISAD